MISVVIPCYNEAKTIKQTYKEVKEALKKLGVKYEIIFSEDGSTDGTKEILKELEKKDEKVRVLVSEKRLGKGLGLRRGFQVAKGEEILMLDADLAAGVGVVKDLLDAEGDVVIADTYRRSFSKRDVMSFLYRCLVALLFGMNLNYIQSGFKKLRREVLEEIDLKLTGFAMDTELVYKAKKKGFRVVEISAKWNQRKDRRVSFLHAFKMFLDLIRVRFLDD